MVQTQPPPPHKNKEATPLPHREKGPHREKNVDNFLGGLPPPLQAPLYIIQTVSCPCYPTWVNLYGVKPEVHMGGGGGRGPWCRCLGFAVYDRTSIVFILCIISIVLMIAIFFLIFSVYHNILISCLHCNVHIFWHMIFEYQPKLSN